MKKIIKLKKFNAFVMLLQNSIMCMKKMKERNMKCVTVDKYFI